MMDEKKREKLIKVLLENSALDLYKTILQEYQIDSLFSLAEQLTDYRLAFRAAWTVEHIFLDQPPLLAEHREKIITLFYSSINESSLRSFSKLIIKLLGPSCQPITTDEEEKIIEKAFQLMEQENCPVALLVNCWEILFLLSTTVHWIQQELKLYITFYLEKNATPATRSRGFRILKKLE